MSGSRLTTRQTMPAGVDALARYADLTEIGRGGMGRILAARDIELDRPVAIKMLLDTGDEATTARFLAEARITGQLEHPNIVPVHELGAGLGGQPYFTMKQVAGESLAELLERRPADLTLTRLLAIFLKVCDAVAFAHDRGVVHRDIKPDNVMLGRFGEVLVMDWGLATMRNAECGMRNRELRSDDPMLTQQGTVLGTPAYMAPEQAEGRIDRIDSRSDIYALGAVLYEMLAHEPAFPQQDVDQCLAAVCAGCFEPPSRRAPGRSVPHDLEQVVRKAMALRPVARYQTVGELQDEILAYLDGRTLRAARYSLAQRLAKWAGRHRAATAAAAVVLLTLGGLLGHQRWRRGRELTAQLEQARGALAAGDHDGALAGFGVALRLAPGNKEAQTGRDVARRLREARRAGEMARAREEALRADLVRRMERLLAQVRALGASRPAPGEPVLEDLIYSGVSLRDPAATAVLGRCLDSLAQQARRAGARVAWTREQRLSAIFACRVLGRSELPQAVDPLVRWLAAVRDVELAIEAGRALCRTASPRAYAPLLAARDRLGPESRAWIQVRALLRRVPEPREQPTSVRGLLRRGLTRLDRGALRPAIADFDAALRLEPRSTDALIARGMARARLRDLRGAIEDYTRAIALRPDLPAAYHNRGGARRRSGDLQGSLADFERALEIDPRQARYWTGRGQTRNLLGDLRGAIADHDQALRLDPRQADALLNRGRARQAARDLSGAMADFGRAIALEPSYWAGYTYRAAARLELGDADGALSDLDRALELEAEVDIVYLQRALVWNTQRQWQRVVDDCSRTLAVNPRSPTAYRLRGRARRELGRVTQAYADFDAAVRLLPRDPILRWYRGNLHWELGRPAPALADADRAIALRPKLAGAHLLRAYALFKLGRKPETIRTLRTFLALAPRSPERPNVERWLRELDGK